MLLLMQRSECFLDVHMQHAERGGPGPAFQQEGNDQLEFAVPPLLKGHSLKRPDEMVGTMDNLNICH